MTDAARTEQQLTPEDRSRLEAAHVALRDAVAAYERFLGVQLKGGVPAPAHDADEMRVAQEAVEAAETRLWQLREDLLGWRRPSWAPSASLTSDWFSDEDAALYDDLPETSAS